MKIRAKMTETCTVVVEFDVPDDAMDDDGEVIDLEDLIVIHGFGKTVHFETEEYSLEAWIKIEEFTPEGGMLTEAEIECEEEVKP